MLEGDEHVTYKEWKKLIKGNFSKYFWIPLNPKKNSKKYHIDISFVKREGIFKDCYSEQQSDYHLKPNALIALNLAEKLCSKQQMQLYLK